MKASNLILASAIGSITLLVVTGAMQLRFGGKTEDPHVEFETRKTELPDFRYVIIRDVRPKMIVSSGVRGEITVNVKAGNEMPALDFYLEGDTLIVNSFTSGPAFSAFNFTLYVPDDVEWIKCRNSSIDIVNYNEKLLSVDLDNSIVSLDAKTNFGKLRINSEDRSDFYVYSDYIDTIDLNMDRSRIFIHASVGRLQGSMSDNSEVSVKEVIDFNFKKDQSSRFNHWNQ